MNWGSLLFLLPILTGPIFIGVGYIMLKFPAKEINNFYGYRSSRSKKSQERWDFAQVFSAKELTRYGKIFTLVAIPGLFFPLDQNTAAPIAIILTLAFTAMPIIKTEQKLKEKFNAS